MWCLKTTESMYSLSCETHARPYICEFGESKTMQRKKKREKKEKRGRKKDEARSNEMAPDQIRSFVNLLRIINLIGETRRRKWMAKKRKRRDGSWRSSSIFPPPSSKEREETKTKMVLALLRPGGTVSSFERGERRGIVRRHRSFFRAFHRIPLNQRIIHWNRETVTTDMERERRKGKKRRNEGSRMPFPGQRIRLTLT